MERQWEESKHPRDDDGKFTYNGGTPAENKRLEEKGIRNKPQVRNSLSAEEKRLQELGIDVDNFIDNFTNNEKSVLKARGIDGDDLLDCEDLADQILYVGGKINQNAEVIVYHASSVENIEKIKKTGKMFSREDSLFFSTKKDGEILGYGQAVIQLKIPIEKLSLNDLFSDEAHLTIPANTNGFTDVSAFL